MRLQVVGVVTLVLGLASSALARGGLYRGPAPNLPVEEPETASLATSPATDWRFWWAYETDAYFRNARRPQDTTVGIARHSKVVPILLSLIRDADEDFVVVSAALLALARTGDPQAADEIMLVASGGRQARHPVVAETAVLALGLIPDESTRITEFLQDRSRSINRPRAGFFQEYAVIALGMRNSRSADQHRAHGTFLDAISAVARDDLHTVATLSLGLEGLNGVSELISIAATGRSSRRDAVSLGSTARSCAATSIGRLGWSRLSQAGRAEAAFRCLEQVLESPEEQGAPHRAAIVGLGLLAGTGDASASARLARSVFPHVHHRSEGVRAAAMIALGRIAAAPHTSKAIREMVLTHCVETIAGASDAGRCHAALAIGLACRNRSSDDEPIIPVALAAVRRAFMADLAPERRGSYAIASGLAQDSLAAPTLLQVLQDPNATGQVRGACAEGLALLGDVRSVPASVRVLLEGMSESRWEAGRSAATCLGVLGTSDQVEALLSVLRNVDESKATLAAAAESLGILRESSAITPLINLATSRSKAPALARAMAVAALGRICESADRTPLSTITPVVDVATSTQSACVRELVRIL